MSSGQLGMIPDGPINDPSILTPGTEHQTQVHRNEAPDGSGIYYGKRGVTGFEEIIGGPGFAGSGLPFAHDTNVAANIVQLAIPLAVLVDGYTFEGEILTTNTGATQLQINATGLRDVVDSDGNPLTAGMIVDDSIYIFAYDLDNDRYQLLGLAKPGPEEIWERGTGLESAKLINTASPNLAAGDHAVAEGSGTQAIGNDSHSEGSASASQGPSSHAEGSGSTTGIIADGGHAEGFNTNSNNIGSHSEGINTIANGEASHAEGSSSNALGNFSHSEGSATIASGINSHAEGEATESIGLSSHAEGNATIATGISSHTEGSGSTALGDFGHAEGNTTQAISEASHAEGQNTEASSDAAHAEGSGTIASGSFSHAEGNFTQATDSGAHSEGQGTIASGVNSHAQGLNTTASQPSAHAEGNNSIASGSTSHAQNNTTIASGNNSHSGGLNTQSVGVNSFNHSSATAAGNSIVTGDNSAIIGGVDNNVDIASPNSVALGGTANNVVGEPDLAQAQNFRVTTDFRATAGVVGTSVLVIGTSGAILNAVVTAASRIFLTASAVAGVQGFLSYVAGAGTFTINSTSATDASTIEYLIVNP